MIEPIIPIWVLTIFSITMIIYLLKNNNKSIVEILLIIILFIINLNINTYKDTEKLNILFVLDTSSSMNNKYIDNRTRIDYAKKTMEKIINSLPNNNYSIITFDNQQELTIPLTDNKDIVMRIINNINTIDKLYEETSSLNTPYKEIINSLKQTNNTILFFISDGSITEENENYNNYSNIKKLIQDGGIININFQKNNNIKKLSRITNLKIINKQSKINNKIKEIQIKKIFYTQKTQKKLIILFFILITIELIDYRRYLPWTNW